MSSSRNWQTTSLDSLAPACFVHTARLEQVTLLCLPLFMAIFMSQRQIQVGTAETVGPTKPKMFIIRPYTGKVYQYLS